jgi:hypothetical protein
LTFYASIAWAALALVGTVVTLVKGRPRARWLAALAVSLLPGLFLLLVDLF